MQPNEQHFLEKLRSGQLVVDFNTGTITSYLSGSPKVIGAHHSQGYRNIQSDGIFILAHRLVWLAAYGDIPAGMQINHRNGNKSDNRLENLELVSRSENTLHARHILGKVFGIFNRDNTGENNGTSKLNWRKVRAIRRLHASGNYTQAALAKMYGVRHTQISNIVNQRCWRE